MIATAATYIQNLIFKCWWVILFCLLCACLYEQGRKKIDLEYQKLHRQLIRLQTIREDKLKLKEELMLKINSQSDPDFVELLLMKELGVVPEGQIKFFFNNVEN